MIKYIAFDCFGTVFNMQDIPKDEVKEYVSHVRQNNFEPYDFPPSWWSLRPHRDAPQGIEILQKSGYKCVALSNGSVDLIYELSTKQGIFWNAIIDLANHKVYKPHLDAYRTIEKDLGYKPSETLMVTANPTFGDVEGAKAIGMPSQVIRHGYPNTIIDLAYHLKSIERVEY